MAGDAFSLATGNCSLNFVLGVGDLTSTTKSFGDEAAEVLEDFSLLIIGVVKFTGPSSIKLQQISHHAPKSLAVDLQWSC